MSDNVFKLILSLIPVIGAIITYFVIPFIKSKVSVANLELIKKWVNYAVDSAELIYLGENQGQNKKDYVIKIISDLINKEKIRITEDQLNTLIEAAVLEVKAAGKESKYLIPQIEDIEIEDLEEETAE